MFVPKIYIKNNHTENAWIHHTIPSINLALSGDVQILAINFVMGGALGRGCIPKYISTDSRI